MSKYSNIFILVIFIGCDNFNNENIEDCAGVVDGFTFIDDCGECVSGNTGNEPNWAMDCNWECFGGLILDCDGVCSGENLDCRGCTNSNAINYDSTSTVDDGSCIWDWEQSTNQAFYFINEVLNIDGNPIEQGIDYVGVFTSDQCVGNRIWSGINIEIPAMGKDGSLPEYLDDGEIPEFRIYDISENQSYIAEIDGKCYESGNYQIETSCGFSNTKLYFIQTLPAIEN